MVSLNTRTAQYNGARPAPNLPLNIMTFPRPAHCFHCNREPVWYADIQLMLGKYYAVVCACGIHGPVAQNKPQAAEKWNAQQVLMKQRELDKYDA